MANELEKAEFYIQEDLDVSRRSALVAKLEHELGIISVGFEGDDSKHLVISYESKHFSHITLLDAIEQHGLRGKLVGT